MSENCSHNCKDCKEKCGERKTMLVDPHPTTHIGKVIGVVSGKGGVGKSLVTSMLAVAMSRKGYRVGIMDADITGPSIPMAFGVKDRAFGGEHGLMPQVTNTGIKVMSINLLLENAEDPVIWRGPVIAGVVKQFWTDVMWGDVDYMFIDMPPGTGDVPLTVFQSLPVDGIIIVASPQELVSMIVEKAVKMANMMKIPVIGLVENMSYVECPDCGKKIYLFGESKVGETAEKYNLPVLAEMPIRPEIAKLCDDGDIESFDGDYMSKAMDIIEKSL